MRTAAAVSAALLLPLLFAPAPQADSRREAPLQAPPPGPSAAVGNRSGVMERIRARADELDALSGRLNDLVATYAGEAEPKVELRQELRRAAMGGVRGMRKFMDELSLYEDTVRIERTATFLTRLSKGSLDGPGAQMLYDYADRDDFSHAMWIAVKRAEGSLKNEEAAYDACVDRRNAGRRLLHIAYALGTIATLSLAGVLFMRMSSQKREVIV